MLRSTLSMGFLQIPQPGGCPGPAANSVKPDVDTHRAGRSRNTRAGYLAKAQHQMLPASWRHSPAGNAISHRGPGQQPEVITGAAAGLRSNIFCVTTFSSSLCTAALPAAI